MCLGIALAWAACGRSESTGEAPAPPPQPAAGAPAPAAAAPAAAAPGAAHTPGSADPARGAAIYAQSCTNCHGPRGAGDGPLAASLDPKPAHHNDGAYMNALSNEHLFKVVKEGGASVGKSPLMAPWGGMLSDAQIWDVVAFVRTLASPPYTGPKP
jgi:mono/diheme cytochrome c family protein